jgi:hypothetical protein
MGNKKLTQRSKEAFISPRVFQTVGMDLEEALLGASKDVYMTIVDTGHETEVYTPDDYWE